MTGNSIWIDSLAAKREETVVAAESGTSAPEARESQLPAFDGKEMSAKNYSACVMLESISDELVEEDDQYFRYARSKRGNVFGIRVKTPKFKRLLEIVGEEHKAEVRRFERMLLKEGLALGASVQIFLSGAICTWQHADDGRRARAAAKAA